MTTPLSEQQAQALRAFRMIFRAVRRHYQLLEKQTGISGAQAWALSLLADQAGMTVGELAVAMSVHQSTASNLVEKLVQLGLASRRKDATDLRVTRLEASARGQRLLAGVEGPITGLLPDALARLDAARLRRLNTALDGLLESLASIEADAAGEPLADILSD